MSNRNTPENDATFLVILATRLRNAIESDSCDRLELIAKRLLASTENAKLCPAVSARTEMDGGRRTCQKFWHHYGNHEADTLRGHVEWNDS